MSRPHPRYRHTPSPDDGELIVEVPVALPLVVMTIRPDATMTVTVDGQPYEPPPFGPSWGRSSFAKILDELTRQRRCPIRVEVHEADGTTFTDIITPPAHRHRALVPALMLEPTPELPARPAPDTAPRSRAFVAVSGAGFVPGEDVAVAVIIAHTDADPDGSARAFLTPGARALSTESEVILLGRVSGTFTLGHPR
ncbi:hypothetical protein GCM10022381_13150 [Leifsonia kafniensis]|uniref:Uncharacterized protein n=1 Tax=Leifsonia kafniensis TaxID=475957 RepID=A0ABP7KBK1_9MICO